VHLTETLIALFALSVGFNWLVDYSERHGWEEGYVSFLVVIGVAYTVTGAAWGGLISWQDYQYLVLAFIASGLPMIIGSVWRHVKMRETERLLKESWARGILKSDPPED
jgi:predicted tellurium resistance membrane protein TerC